MKACGVDKSADGLDRARQNVATHLRDKISSTSDVGAAAAEPGRKAPAGCIVSEKRLLFEIHCE